MHLGAFCANSAQTQSPPPPAPSWLPSSPRDSPGPRCPSSHACPARATALRKPLGRRYKFFYHPRVPLTHAMLTNLERARDTKCNHHRFAHGTMTVNDGRGEQR
jgi:hypothetical protein